jgi:hypothetical protein
VVRPVASTSGFLRRGARTGTHHAEYAILILRRKLQRREARFGEAAVGFDGLEDPAYVNCVRVRSYNYTRRTHDLPLSSDELDSFAARLGDFLLNLGRGKATPCATMHICGTKNDMRHRTTAECNGVSGPVCGQHMLELVIGNQGCSGPVDVEA